MILSFWTRFYLNTLFWSYYTRFYFNTLFCPTAPDFISIHYFVLLHQILSQYIICENPCKQLIYSNWLFADKDSRYWIFLMIIMENIWRVSFSILLYFHLVQDEGWMEDEEEEEERWLSQVSFKNIFLKLKFLLFLNH